MKWMHKLGVLALGGVSVSALAAESVEREADTSSSPSVEIELDSGFLEIKTWDRDAVRIEGTLDDNVEEWSFDASRNSVDIEIEDEDYRGGDWGNVDWDDVSSTQLVLYVPAGARVAFEGTNTSMTAAGIQGGLEAETVNGSLMLSDLSGPVEANSVNGDVEVENASDALELGTVNGKIKVVGATGSALEASSVNGDIDIESTATDIELEAVSADIVAMLNNVERMDISVVSGDLEGRFHLMDGARLDVASVSGDIELYLVEPINIRVDANSMSGSLENDITDAKAEKEGFIGKSLSFTTGNASASVEVSTVSGDLELKPAN